jgi:hypothetical protein
VSGRRSRIWREVKPFVAPMLLVAVYAIVREVFAQVAGSQGFVTPSGSPGTGLVAFAVILLVMRITMLVAVPLIVTYRVIRRLVALVSSGGDGAATGDGASADETPRSGSTTRAT